MDQLVSIVIPCYNGEGFVGEAIESALTQTYRNSEVIVIDDGSTDASLEIITSFTGRIRWESTPNSGGCAARNRGIEIAAGKWIQFLDADDVLFPEKLTRMMKVIQPNKKEIIFSDFRIVNWRSGELSISPRPFEGARNFEFMLEAERLGVSSPVYPIAGLEEVGGFDERLTCAQEYDLNLRLTLAGWSFRRFPEVLFEQRVRKGSVSSNYAHVLRQHETIFKKLLLQNPKVALGDVELRRVLSWRLVRNARLLTKLGDRQGAQLAVSTASTLGIRTGINQSFSWKSLWLAHLVGPIYAERFIQKLMSLARRITGAQSAVHRLP